MCTVTWIEQPDRYSLFFNRDELRTRLPARPPEIHTGDRARYVAPIDGDAEFARGGGMTLWLAADSQRTPQRIEFDLPFGVLVATLAPPESDPEADNPDGG